MNRKVKILSLKDVAWLERAKLILLIFHLFVCKFDRVVGAAHEKKNKDKWLKN